MSGIVAFPGIVNFKYNFSSFVDSLIIEVGIRRNNGFNLHSKVGYKYDFELFPLDYLLFFPMPGYGQMIDSIKKEKNYTIDRIYTSLSDSIYKVRTIINKKELAESNIFKSIYSNSKNFDIDYKKTKPDISFVKDSIIVTSKGNDYLGHIIVKREIFLYKKPVKVEYFTRDRDTLLNYSVINKNYDKKKRMIYYDENIQANGSLIKVVIKTFAYKKNGNRIETIDHNGVDGKIDELWEYDGHNRLVRKIKYYQEYNIKSSTSITTYVEFKKIYNSKGLLIHESVYRNGILQNEKIIKYSYYNN